MFGISKVITKKAGVTLGSIALATTTTFGSSIDTIKHDNFSNLLKLLGKNLQAITSKNNYLKGVILGGIQEKTKELKNECSLNDISGCPRLVYNFNDLDSGYSEEGFKKKGFGDFLTLIEDTFNRKGHDKDDTELLVQNIIFDLESGDIEGVRMYLSDEGLDKSSIDSIISKMPNTLAIAPELINNLGDVDFDKAVDEYVETGIIPKGYEFFESYFKEIGDIIKRGEEARRRGEEARRRGEEADKIIKKIEEIKQRIKNIGTRNNIVL